MREGGGGAYGPRMRKLLPQTTAAALLLGAALIVSSTGGAVAGAAVTSAQIKNGTITAKDIKSKSLSAGLFAPDATAALTGPKGPQGVAGTPGANGVSGFELVPYTSPGTSTTDEITHTMHCPAGKVVLGGAAVISGPPSATTYEYIYPLDQDSWLAGGAGSTTATKVLQAWITCGRVV